MFALEKLPAAFLLGVGFTAKSLIDFGFAASGAITCPDSSFEFTVISMDYKLRAMGLFVGAPPPVLLAETSNK